MAKTNQSTHATSEDLPTELWVEILRHINDLTTLANLLHVSSKAGEAWELNAHQITDRILNNGLMCKQSREIFRICTLLRTGTLPIDSLERFEAAVLVEDPTHIDKWKRTCPHFLTLFLERDMQVSVIRDVLESARVVGGVIVECLDFFLNRFKALRPYVSGGPPKSLRPYGSSTTGHRILVGHVDDSPNVWTPKKKGRPLNTKDLGPPVWIEEQRLGRAVWRFQLMYDVKQAAREGKLRWSESDITELLERPILNPPNVRDPVDDEPRLYSEPPVDTEDGDSKRGLWPVSLQAASGAGMLDNEHEEMRSILDYVNQEYAQDIANGLAMGNLPLTELKRAPKMSRPWPIPPKGDAEAIENLQFDSSGVDVYNLISRGDPNENFSPVMFVDFAYYRQYGIAFWTMERLRGCGLSDRWIHSKDHFSWYSLLSHDDILQVERRGKKVRDKRIADRAAGIPDPPRPNRVGVRLI